MNRSFSKKHKNILLLLCFVLVVSLGFKILLRNNKIIVEPSGDIKPTTRNLVAIKNQQEVKQISQTVEIKEPDEIAGDKDLLKQISALTTQEKVGQLVLASLPNLSLDDFTKTLIRDYKIGGLILFRQNIQSIEQTQELITRIQQENSSEIPMFIALDEEGGAISRLPKTMAKTPSAQSIGDRNDPSYAYEQGKIVGEHLKTLGVNLNFAPVCDLNLNPNNSGIGNRAFSSDPNIAGAMAKEFYKGLTSQGVLGCIKHFPGHGDSNMDSHIDLPMIDNSEAVIKARELLPFKILIDEGVGMVMVSHLMIQAIDANLPATLSSSVKQKLLFEYLNFKGVVITDDLGMKAITKNYSLAEGAIMAFNSGCDIILISGSSAEIELVLNTLTKAVAEGVITQERLNDAVYKILLEKKKIK